jgi:AGCS family alanine or glycine:cation symporter
MGGALGGGNMFQSNQTVEALTTTFGMTVTDATGATVPDPVAKWTIGIVMALFVGAVILGGIKRIGAATSRIVPVMVAIYVIASIFVIAVNIGKLPGAVATMFSMAFSENAFYGGLMGVLVVGVQRAAFSNEAGLGSAAIAHAAAKTDEPVREGLVAMLGPFIDTIVVCFMTAMVVIVTGQWNAPEGVNANSLQGSAVTAGAFASVISWFPYVLSVCIALFAYSTQVSWCYYGERGWIYLLDHFNGAGLKSVFVFRLIFVIAVVVGATNKLGDVLDFSDIMILSMAFPNIIGSIILAPRLLKKLQDYGGRYQRGEMKTYDERIADKAKANEPA